VVLKWLHSTGCPWGVRTCSYAAAGGHLEMLKWLHRTGCPWDYGTSEAAAGGGHLEVLQWALEYHWCPWWPLEMLCSHAAHGGNREILRWLDEQGVDMIGWDS